MLAGECKSSSYSSKDSSADEDEEGESESGVRAEDNDVVVDDSGLMISFFRNDGRRRPVCSAPRWWVLSSERPGNPPAPAEPPNPALPKGEGEAGVWYTIFPEGISGVEFDRRAGNAWW